MSDPQTRSEESPSSLPPPRNPAVQRCIQAFTDSYNAFRAQGSSDYSAANDAAPAYRHALPDLASEDSISDFIACVAYGISIGVFKDRQGSQLLYAAQVASGNLARVQKRQRRVPQPSTETAT